MLIDLLQAATKKKHSSSFAATLRHLGAFGLFSFAILVLVLLLRPQGLLGRRVA